MQILDPIMKLECPIKLHIDNLSMKYVAKSVLTSHRTKHLEICYLFIHQLLIDHPILLKWVLSEDNIADIFTKYFTTVGAFKGLVIPLKHPPEEEARRKRRRERGSFNWMQVANSLSLPL
jgi:hypothetical protein